MWQSGADGLESWRLVLFVGSEKSRFLLKGEFVDIYFFALVFLAAGFLTTFLAGFLGDFLVTLTTFLGEAFLVAVFFAAGFLAAGFLVAVFLTTFLAAGFLAAGFLTGSALAILKEPESPTPFALARVPASSIRLQASLREVAWRGPTLFFDSIWADIAFKEAPLRPEKEY